MHKIRGFTLIELLVVISIIALLMAILMPALAKVRSQARAVACMSQLNQWTKIFYMYTSANQDMFPPKQGLVHDNCEWLKPYCKDLKLLLCPSATKPLPDARQPFCAHLNNGVLASYGMNSWLTSEKSASGTDTHGGNWRWKTTNIKGANYVPMVFDCAGWQNATPHRNDNAPEYDGDCWWNSNSDEMKYACLNRHNRAINMGFVDFSVRKVPLKQLWELKWHRGWDQEPVRVDPWPVWMAAFSENF